MTRVTAARIGFDVRETGGRGQNPRRGGLNSRFGRDALRPERVGSGGQARQKRRLGRLDPAGQRSDATAVQDVPSWDARRDLRQGGPVGLGGDGATTDGLRRPCPWATVCAQAQNRIRRARAMRDVCARKGLEASVLGSALGATQRQTMKFLLPNARRLAATGGRAGWNTSCSNDPVGRPTLHGTPALPRGRPG